MRRGSSPCIGAICDVSLAIIVGLEATVTMRAIMPAVCVGNRLNVASRPA